MSGIEVAIAAFMGGLIGGMATSWRTWRDLMVDIRYHGFDNHFCQRAGCCR